MSTESKKTLCPRCKTNYSFTVHLALSRRDNKTYICNLCGTQEALIDNGIIKADKIENDFVKLLQEGKQK